MWTQTAQKSRDFRNARAVLEVSGYAVTVEPNVVRVSKAKAGREWECGNVDEFFDVCAFHCWEAFDISSTGDVRSKLSRDQGGTPRTVGPNREWTSNIHEDPDLRQAVRRFYKKGYAIRIKRGSISFGDRTAVQHDVRTKEAFLKASYGLGTEKVISGKTAVRHPPVVIRGGGRKISTETLASLDARMKASEARASAAVTELDRLRAQVNRYAQLKQAVVAELDPKHAKTSGLEKLVRAEIFKILEGHIAAIEGNTPPVMQPLMPSPHRRVRKQSGS